MPALESQTVALAHGTRAAASAPALRVLVVDDNVDAASSVADLLGALGHEVQESYDGASAVAEAERFRPHLVLLDLGMPLMDGFQAARSMRQHDWGRRMHIAALTGWGQDQVRHRTREAGFDDHFVKPMGLQDMTQLLEVVRVQ